MRFDQQVVNSLPALEPDQYRHAAKWISLHRLQQWIMPSEGGKSTLSDPNILGNHPSIILYSSNWPSCLTSWHLATGLEFILSGSASLTWAARALDH